MTPQPSRGPREWMTNIWIVVTPTEASPDTWDIEVLDARPTWDWVGDGSFVRLANVNGGDSVTVVPASRPGPPREEILARMIRAGRRGPMERR